MKTAEMVVGSVVVVDSTYENGNMVVLGFTEVDNRSNHSRYAKKVKRIEMAKMYVNAGGEVTYQPCHVMPAQVLRIYAPDPVSAAEKMKADFAARTAWNNKSTNELADRKVRMAAVMARMAELGLKQSEYAAESGSYSIKLSLADIEALLSKV